MADDSSDIAIPGESYTFGVLKQAQALGDYESLASRGRRAIRIHLGSDVDAGLGPVRHQPAIERQRFQPEAR